MIETIFQEHGLSNDFEICNIEQAQGGERKIIFISLVRTSYDSVGFLSDKRRLTVALTRAKIAEVVCGNFDALYAANYMYAGMTKYYETHGFLDRDSNKSCVERPQNYFQSLLQ